MDAALCVLCMSNFCISHTNYIHTLLCTCAIIILLAQEFLTLDDKFLIIDELLSLCGWKINKLINEIEGNQMASLMAHLSPNMLQWIKKQVINLLYW